MALKQNRRDGQILVIARAAAELAALVLQRLRQKASQYLMQLLGEKAIGALSGQMRVCDAELAWGF
ncbi:hypothetical protein [Roseateles albus]|uniref:Uncharacterized protein n=1 Tax=Roseateles albus TaxID=2987525 RepID=A0ABT5KHG0_9BURK|nr:hypothetical protein [Roseateles albus]MDC8773347.1 hypothetical protein [Roseateles albus]